MPLALKPYNRDVPDGALIDELQRVANLLNQDTVTIAQFNEHAKFNSKTLERRFGSWLKALEMAGLKPSRKLHLTNEKLFENLLSLWLKHGRQPARRDFTKTTSSFSYQEYEYRFGTWSKALEAFVAWSNDGEPRTASPSESSSGPRRTPRQINARLRARVLMRDGSRCQLCGADVSSGATLHVDHVVPYSKGGETTLENLQVLCHVCNVGKSDYQLP